MEKGASTLFHSEASRSDRRILLTPEEIPAYRLPDMR
jgi:hypothetical protein